MVNTSRLHTIIVAGGSGTRFGADVPKQFVELAGTPVLLRALSALRAAAPEATYTVVLSPQWEEYFTDLCRSRQMALPIIAHGGATRWESVRNGLATVAADTDIVLVHDGARPFPTPKILNALVQAIADGAQGAVPAVPVTDSLRRVNPDNTSCAVERAALRAVQTPQAFRSELLRRAYELPYSEAFTDDASVMEAARFTDIRLTPGEPTNIKITNPADLIFAEALISNSLV